jgi:hypothetical protein
MLKFFIDIFCKDTIVGLSQFEDFSNVRIYKNRQSRLFSKKCLKSKNHFIDPIACRL